MAKKSKRAANTTDKKEEDDDSTFTYIMLVSSIIFLISLIVSSIVIFRKIWEIEDSKNNYEIRAINKTIEVLVDYLKSPKDQQSRGSRAIELFTKFLANTTTQELAIQAAHNNSLITHLMNGAAINAVKCTNIESQQAIHEIVDLGRALIELKGKEFSLPSTKQLSSSLYSCRKTPKTAKEFLGWFVSSLDSLDQDEFAQHINSYLDYAFHMNNFDFKAQTLHFMRFIISENKNITDSVFCKFIDNLSEFSKQWSDETILDICYASHSYKCQSFNSLDLNSLCLIEEKEL